MPIEKHEIVTYAVSVISAKRGPAAIVHAQGPGDPATHVYLRYYRAGHARPDNSRIEAEDGSVLYMISFRYEQLAASVDLLRHESPMFFVWNDKSNSGHLATSDEPTGEGSEDADMVR